MIKGSFPPFTTFHDCVLRSASINFLKINIFYIDKLIFLSYNYIYPIKGEKMKKFTRAFQLEPIKNPVKVTEIKGVNYPYDTSYTMNNEVFIRGQGLKKVSNTIAIIKPLPENWTAENIQEIGKKYGVYVAMGMLQGWGTCSLFDDGSIGLDYAKHEVVNMVKYGLLYDQYTDMLQKIGNDFIRCILKNGYRIDGKWLYYKDNLIGMTGMYETIHLHPLQHVDHCLRGLVNIPPLFDSISFDRLLVTLIMEQDNSEKKLDTFISVRDRIAYLSTDDIANNFEKLFELETKMWHVKEVSIV